MEDLRRSTFALIERAGADAASVEDRRAIVTLQRVAYELGCVEALLDERTACAA